jgi:hypothetical protein
MATRRGKPRDSVKEQFWRRTIADQGQSDLAVQVYCRRKGLNPGTFRFRRQELTRRDAEVMSSRPDERPASSAERAPFRLVSGVTKRLATTVGYLDL